MESTLVRWLTQRYPPNVLRLVRFPKKYATICGEAPCPHPLTQAVKRVRQSLCLPSNLAWQYPSWVCMYVWLSQVDYYYSKHSIALYSRLLLLLLYFKPDVSRGLKAKSSYLVIQGLSKRNPGHLFTVQTIHTAPRKETSISTEGAMVPLDCESLSSTVFGA